MNAAQLIGLAQARGINLSHVAGASSNLDGDGAERALTKAERKLGLREVRETVKGRESRGMRRPGWSASDLGMAAQGVGSVPWCAALYSLAGARDGRNYQVLWSALTNEANRIGRREAWPMRVAAFDGSMKFFREELCALTLDVDAHRALFRAAPPGTLEACYMNVKVETWQGKLEGPYRSLEDTFSRWCSTARATISRWITEEA